MIWRTTSSFACERDLAGGPATSVDAAGSEYGRSGSDAASPRRRRVVAGGRTCRRTVEPVEHRQGGGLARLVAAKPGAAARHVAREVRQRRLGALEVAEHLGAVGGGTADAFERGLEAARR